jgi:hypothetical protein
LQKVAILTEDIVDRVNKSLRLHFKNYGDSGKNVPPPPNY